MIMPSIALPTGPYDWSEAIIPRAVFEKRIAVLRDLMSARGAAHCVVHGNGFDHASLGWLSHFTPKLGPAIMLVAMEAAPRLHFSGGPGMKPSATRLTWIADVSALRGIEADIRRWLGETSAGASPRLAAVTGASILLGDWRALEAAAGGPLIELDPAVEAARDALDNGRLEKVTASARVLSIAACELVARATEGDDAHAAVIAMERAAYAAGAQDARIRVAREPWGRPATLSDDPMTITGPRPVMLAVRRQGVWTSGRFVLGAVDEKIRAAARARLLAARDGDVTIRPLVNRVAWPEADPVVETGDGIHEAVARIPVEGATANAVWSALFVSRGGKRDIIWTPPEP